MTSAFRGLTCCCRSERAVDRQVDEVGIDQVIEVFVKAVFAAGDTPGIPDRWESG
jgi:hypothetical protein